MQAHTQRYKNREMLTRACTYTKNKYIDARTQSLTFAGSRRQAGDYVSTRLHIPSITLARTYKRQFRNANNVHKHHSHNKNTPLAHRNISQEPLKQQIHIHTCTQPRAPAYTTRSNSHILTNNSNTHQTQRAYRTTHRPSLNRHQAFTETQQTLSQAITYKFAHSDTCARKYWLAYTYKGEPSLGSFYSLNGNRDKAASFLREKYTQPISTELTNSRKH